MSASVDIREADAARALSAETLARIAWGVGVEPPAWALALARECDRTSLRRTAARLGVSPALISLGLRRKRGYSPEFLRRRVELVLLNPVISCPVLGEIDLVRCQKEQKRSFGSHNPLRVRLYRACHGGCQFFQNNKGD